MSPANPSPAIWYVTAGGREQGPFTAAQVKTLVQQGKIVAATPIRKEGMAQSVAAASVQGLLPVNPPAQAPAPAQQAQPTATNPPAPAQQAPPAAEAEPESQPAPDSEASDSEDSRRASVLYRIISALIDQTILLVLLAILFAAALIFATGPRSTAEGEIIEVWENEFEALHRHNHRESFLRILDRESFPQVDPATPLAQILAEVDGLIEAFAAIAPELDAESVRDRVVLQWRERQADAPGQDEPITDEERQAVEEWGQYTEFRAWVQGNERSLRNNLRDGMQSRFRAFRSQHEQRLADADARGTVRFLIVFLIAICLLWLLTPLCEVFLKATPGKLIFGLRVATLSHRPIGLGRALLRQVYRMIPGELFFVFGQGRQALHDQWTGTQVIPAALLESGPAKGRGRKARGPRARPGPGRGKKVAAQDQEKE